MHVPDGLLSVPVCAATGAASTAAVGYSVRRLRDRLADRTIPMIGMMAALVFAGQMVNFPLVGISGHLLGGVLCAAVLGPWAGCLAMTIVLVVQCLLFGDGGLLALGANVLHMAVIGVWGGYAVYRFLLGSDAGPRRMLMAAMIASWLSVMAAAAAFCLEFRLSHPAGAFDYRNVFSLIVAFHSLIGIGEAVITGLLVRFLYRHRPDLLYGPVAEGGSSGGVRRVVAAGLVAALAIAAFLSPFASSLPDGLEAAAERTGMARLERSPAWSVFSDYELPAIGWQPASVAAAGIIGVVSVVVLALLMSRTLSGWKSDREGLAA
ncbi:MAG: cobalt ABC transporter permease [Planctomycetota bacterium]|nr:MAG: cobalt ABC transporter permease [Planctomycetota bacterium]